MSIKLKELYREYLNCEFLLVLVEGKKLVKTGGVYCDIFPNYPDLPQDYILNKYGIFKDELRN